VLLAVCAEVISLKWKPPKRRLNQPISASESDVEEPKEVDIGQRIRSTSVARLFIAVAKAEVKKALSDLIEHIEVELFNRGFAFCYWFLKLIFIIFKVIIRYRHQLSYILNACAAYTFINRDNETVYISKPALYGPSVPALDWQQIVDLPIGWHGTSAEFNITRVD